MSMNCVFSGPPRSGKTTVMKRLKGQKVDVKKLTTSTDIIDERGPVRMDIMPSCSIVTDQHWVEMEENDEVQAFLNLTIIPNTSDVVTNAKEFEETSRRDKVSEEQDKIVETQTDNAHIEVDALEDEPKNERNSESLEHSSVSPIKHSSLQGAEYIDLASSHPLPSPQNVLKQAQHHSQQIRATRQLCKRHFLRFTDTGGQPELRRFTPLLIPGPSVTFIVFRLNDKLDERLVSKICLATNSERENEEVPYGSYYYINDTIQDIILNIFCQERKSKVRSLIMFIGTHKDLLPEDSAAREECIKEKNEEIIGELEKCAHYDEDMIVKCGNQVLFPVNNSIFDKEHKFIQSSVHRLCDSDKFNVQVDPQQLLLAPDPERCKANSNEFK